MGFYPPLTPTVTIHHLGLRRCQSPPYLLFLPTYWVLFRRCSLGSGRYKDNPKRLPIRDRTQSTHEICDMSYHFLTVDCPRK
jgi:hypothetical protein